MRTLPPGSRLPMAAQTYLFGRYRHRWLPRLRRRHGDVFSLRIAPRNRRLVVIADPGLIREVFAGPPTVFHAGESNAVLKPLLGAHSVLLTDEEEHAMARRRLLPAFSGAALRGYRDLVATVARDHLARWPADRPIRSHPRLQALTLDVIIRVIFGVADPERVATMRPLVERIVSVRPLIMLAGYYPGLRKHGPWRRHLEWQQRLDDLLYAEIAERRGVPGLAERTDLLSRLLADPEAGWSDEQLRDQLITLLLAGHETTATALSWTVHELARNPAVQQAARRAADDGDPEYLEATAKEALRLHPVIFEVGRKLTQPIRLGDHELPAGVSVMPAIGLVHADPDHHPAPEQFRPERFLGDDPPTSQTWLPFGGGVRRCLGAGFALMESQVVLRELLARFRLEAPDNRPEPVVARNVTLAPGRGARVVLRARYDGGR